LLHSPFQHGDGQKGIYIRISGLYGSDGIFEHNAGHRFGISSHFLAKTLRPISLDHHAIVGAWPSKYNIAS